MWGADVYHDKNELMKSFADELGIESCPEGNTDAKGG